jgi:hypothetical protein
MIEWLTAHSRTVGSEQGPCFMSPFWYLEFHGDAYIFGKLVKFYK